MRDVAAKLQVGIAFLATGVYTPAACKACCVYCSSCVGPHLPHCHQAASRHPVCNACRPEEKHELLSCFPTCMSAASTQVNVYTNNGPWWPAAVAVTSSCRPQGTHMRNATSCRQCDRSVWSVHICMLAKVAKAQCRVAHMLHLEQSLHEESFNYVVLVHW